MSKSFRPGKKTAIGGGVVTILAAVFALEGGYVNHKNDPGGATNHGITQAVARKHGFEGSMRTLKRSCTRDGEVCAESILTRDYIERPGFLPLVDIEPNVAEEVIDTAVNMGPRRPSKYFQRAVNRVCRTRLRIDGRIGRTSVQAWRDCYQNLGPKACVAMIRSLDAQQKAEYFRLIRRNPKLRVFRRGWLNHRIGNVSTARCYQAL